MRPCVCPTSHQRLSLLARSPTRCAPARVARSRAFGRATPPLLMLVVPSRASGRSPAESRAPMSAARVGGARAPRPESTDWSQPLLPYVANVCFKCFRYFRGMLQVFRMDVAKVDREVAYVASVSDACCKRLFEMFHLFHTYIVSVFIWILYMFYTCLVRVCSKCFSCFSLILQ
jgi:hypothetical protein